MEDNIGGRRADEKTGFKYEGTLRELIMRNGKHQNVCVYSMLRSEYLEKYGV